jgi:hypothetical protein
MAIAGMVLICVGFVLHIIISLIGYGILGRNYTVNNPDDREDYGTFNN